ncbi:DNA topology modulation protein [Exiguobacterium sp. H66]|uniref:DNA topology modulation protein n=1 Tax=Exiguobacterium sp. H66 TaxID=2751208 RepID=UPI001BECBED2|nr:DNA topology modulation protein [Exiguobacterium sp. H66]
MKKIIIIGSGGSGKSTFGRQLHEQTGIKVSHLDALFWKPNWVAIPRDEQIEVQQQLMEQPEWILDGNYGGTLGMRLDAADTVIFLDMPRTVCAYRVIKRNLKYRNRTRPDMGEGCIEQFSWQFLKWVWQYPKARRPGVLRQLDEVRHEKNVVILSSKRDVQTFLDQL